MKYHAIDELRIPLELWTRIEATRDGFKRKGSVYEKQDQSAYVLHLLDVAVTVAEKELKARKLAGRAVLLPDEVAGLEGR